MEENELFCILQKENWTEMFLTNIYAVLQVKHHHLEALKNSSFNND